MSKTQGINLEGYASWFVFSHYQRRGLYHFKENNHPIKIWILDFGFWIKNP
jgi:hypothetical protein